MIQAIRASKSQTSSFILGGNYSWGLSIFWIPSLWKSLSVRRWLVVTLFASSLFKIPTRLRSDFLIRIRSFASSMTFSYLFNFAMTGSKSYTCEWAMLSLLFPPLLAEHEFDDSEFIYWSWSGALLFCCSRIFKSETSTSEFLQVSTSIGLEISVKFDSGSGFACVWWLVVLFLILSYSWAIVRDTNSVDNKLLPTFKFKEHLA